MKRLIMDLDDTICSTSKGDYENSKPNQLVIEKLSKYKNEGFEIVIHTSRNMRTYKGNVGKINIHTLPNIINWLNKNNVPYDEIIIGKPWCGFEGFYVDDKSIRPSEFIGKTYAEIQLLLDKEKNK
ncbi:HAD-IIIC family phosphatase [Flavobacteriaceae bacterium]|jgi:capsule biosynthesis phosphatase|nr:HAD-IIIC family phosphatase [Flavobacteriaceae bacterium]